MDPGRDDAETSPKALPNANPITSSGDSNALTVPTSSGRYPTNHVQYSTTVIGGDTMTPTSLYGPAVGQTTGYNVSVVHNYLMDPNHPLAQHQTMGQNLPTAQNQHTLQNQATTGNESLAQNHPMFQAYHMAQNQPNMQHPRTVHNFGFVAPTVPKPQEGIHNNAAPITQLQHQMWANAHSIQATDQVQPSTNSPPMTQASQPAQSANQSPSGDADVAQVLQWLEDEGDDYGNYIQGFRNVTRYKEAERRIRQELTPSLASDFPANETQQNELAHRLFQAFKVWRLGIPGWTNQAINKVRLQKKFILELTAWQLLEAARDAQRGELLLSDKYSIEGHDTFMARFQAIEQALSTNVHLAGSAFDSDEWIDRIAAAPELECDKKKGNVRGNNEKNNKLKLVTKRRIPKDESDSTSANTSSRRSSRAPTKRQKTSPQVSTVEDNNQLHMPANQSIQNAQMAAHQDLLRDQQPFGPVNNQLEVNNYPQLNYHPQGNNFTPGSNYTESLNPTQDSMAQDPWIPINELVRQQRLSVENDPRFGRVSTQLSDVQGYVPVGEYQHVRNGMTRPPGTTLPPTSQQGAFVQGNVNQGGPAVSQINQSGPAMDQQSRDMQQVPIGMDGDYMFNPNDPVAVTTRTPATQHGGAPQAGVNWGSPAMGQLK